MPKIKKREVPLFTTNDIILASYLYSRGFTLKSISKESFPRDFIFEAKHGKETAAKSQENYFNGKLLVEPKQFMTSIRHIKSKLRETLAERHPFQERKPIPDWQ